MKRLLQYPVKRAFCPAWFVDGFSRKQYYSIVSEFRLRYLIDLAFFGFFKISLSNHSSGF